MLPSKKRFHQPLSLTKSQSQTQFANCGTGWLSLVMVCVACVGVTGNAFAGNCGLVESGSIVSYSIESDATNSQANGARVSALQQEQQSETWSVTGAIVGDDQSVEGIQVEIYRIDYDHDGLLGESELIGKAASDSEGKFNVSVNIESILSKVSEIGEKHIVVCRDRTDGKVLTGREIRLNPSADTRQPYEIKLPIKLFKFEPAEFVLVDQDGNVIPGAEVELTGYGLNPFGDLIGNRRSGSSSRRLDFPDKLFKRTRSDEEGRVRLENVPTTGTVMTEIRLPNGARYDVQFDGRIKRVELDSSASISGRIVVDQPGLDFSGVKIRFGLIGPETIHGEFVCTFWDLTPVHDDGSFSLPNVPPGTYNVSVRCKDKRFYSQRQQEFKVAAGEQFEYPEINMHEGVPLSGKITDGEGNGVPDVHINIHAISLETGRGFWSGYEKTNQAGEFEARVPRAKLNISPSGASGFLNPDTASLQKWKDIDTTTGSETYELPSIEMRRGISVEGRVVDQTGNPVAGARVSVMRESLTGGAFLSTNSNDDGQFTVDGLDPKGLIELRAIAGETITDGGLVLDLIKDKHKGIELVVSPDHAFRMTGQLVDSNNQPIRNAKVAIHRSVRIVSRRGAGGGYGSKWGDFLTDENGRFETSNFYAGDNYHAEISADNFVAMTLPMIVGEPGKKHDYGKVKLRRSNLIVGGTVVDATGNPLHGVSVFNVGDAPAPIETKTDDLGRFRLSGIPEGGFYVFARGEGIFAGTFVESASDKIRLEVGKPVDQTKPVLLPYTEKERKELGRYILEQLYALPADKRTKIDFLILRYMARVDPEQAIKWANEPVNNRLRNDVMIEVASTLIDEKPEEALELIRQIKAGNSFYRIFQIAERSLVVSPQMTSQLAEILAVQVEMQEPPEQAYDLAKVAGLLKAIGEDEASAQFAERAFKMAESLTGEQRQSFIMGYSAELLATIDVERSLQLIEKMQQTQGTSKERHLGGLAARIAETNPQKAIEIGSKIGGRYAPRIAYHLARFDPSVAERFVSSVADRGEVKYATDGLVAVAQAVSHQRTELAEKLLNQALDNCMLQHSDFNSWINYGCESAPAGWAAAMGHRVGAVDQRQLVLKALASRRGAAQGNVHGAIYPMKGTLKMCKYLALVDRQDAMNVLKKFDLRPELLGGGGYDSLDRQDFLMAWCLADHDRAKKEIDKYLATLAKTDRPIEQNDLTRLLGVITASEDQFYSGLSDGDALWYPGRE